MERNSQALYGTIIKNQTIAGFILTETAYHVGLHISKHSHEFAYFCFVLQGGFTERCEQQTRICNPFSLIFHPPQERHADEFNAPTKCFNLQLSRSFLEQTSPYSAFTGKPADFGVSVSKQIAAKIYKEFRHTDELSSLIVEGLMFELWGESLRFSKNNLTCHPPLWLKQTLELLHERFQESLSLGEIAATAGVHKTHLSREFKRYYGSTVGDYLRRLRIEFACRQLSASDLPLSEIALLSGFADQSHFTKSFRHVMATSPATYRKNFRR